MLMLMLSIVSILIIQMLSMDSIHAASKYTGGLLDNKPLSSGTNFTSPTSTSVVGATDGNVNSKADMAASSMLWYTFDQPQEINSLIVNATIINNVKVEFYDDKDNLVLSYTPIANDGVESLPVSAKNIKNVILKTSPSGNTIYEWNVFTTPAAAPSVPTITRTYGGDKVVNLYWNNKGARSYNVKRSTSEGGPYSVIAEGIKGLTFTDKNVVNGTT